MSLTYITLKILFLIKCCLKRIIFSERERSPVRRLSVTFVYRTQPVEIFGNFSTPLVTLAIR